MAKTQVLDYYIHLTDQDRVDTLNAQIAAGGGADVGALIYNPQTGEYGVYRAPYAAGPPEAGAAVEFKEVGTLPRLAGADSFVTPCIKSDWFGKGFQTDVATFTRSTGWWLFGSSTRFYWSGHFVYSPSPVADTGTLDADNYVRESAPIPQRLFIDGFEEPLAGAEGTAVASLRITRAASRSLNGYGGALRRNTTSVAHRQHSYSPTRAETWERFYVRLRRAPSAATEIYQAKYLGTNPGGMFLYVLPGRTLAVYANSGTTTDLVGTVAGTLTLDRWHVIDVIHRYLGGTPNFADIQVWVDKLHAGQGGFVPGGLVGNCVLSASMCGRSDSSVISDIEIDYDDWIACEPPEDKRTHTPWDPALSYALGNHVGRGVWDETDDVPISLRGRPMNWVAKQAVGINLDPLSAANSPYWHLLTDAPDWLVGSHIENIRPTAFAAGHGAWGAAVVQQFQVKHGNTSTTDVPSTTVALDPVVCDMDVALLRKVPGVVGYNALDVHVLSSRGTTSGTLGYDIGAGAVMAAIVETAGLTPSNAFYRPGAMTDIALLPSTLRAKYIKGNDVTTGRVKSLRMMVELLGSFTNCDTATDSIDEAPGYHNAPYLVTPWSRVRQPPLGPVVIKSGTYVGNGTATELTFPAPVHFLYIRATTAAQAGSIWHPGMIGSGHAKMQQGVADEFLNRVDANPDYVPVNPATSDQQTECRVSIVGANAGWNANAVSYEYVAIMDPAHRYVLAGAAHHVNNINPVTDTLEDPTFTPEVGFFQKADLSTTITVNAWWKQTGHAAAGAQVLAAAETATAITFGLGTVAYDSGFNTATEFEQIAAYVLFRRHDGNGDAGEPALWAYGSYVGDGNASRTISLPASGKRPLFAIIGGATAVVPQVRDPLHTGTNSCGLTTGTNTTTGITGGGVDSVSVGVTLNTNGVTFNYFVVLGGATAGNNGWSADGTFTPVASDSARASTWAEPTFPAAVTAPTTGGSTVADPGDLTTDIVTTGTAPCNTASTRLVNIALSRIGVTVRLASLAADVSQEASDARLVYKTELDATLRDFPWPFATRYATLALVAGTADVAVNNDWQYSYRAPSDSVFVRRIANADEQRAFSRSPIPFRMGQDASGDLVYTNEPGTLLDDGTDIVVEYTKRVDCPAQAGDAIFRSAAAWRLAAALVAPLARDVKLIAFCEQRYQLELARARTVHAREQEQQHLESTGEADWIDGR